jgi:hypothetical protein
MRIRIRIALIVVLLGLLIFVFGADPGLFGMDRSPVVGFVQIAVFLVGLVMICIGGYVSLNTLWNGMEKTIIADIGLRLVSTGIVISVASGMADVFGLGNQPFPNVPYFGIWQALGVIIGQLIIAVGLIMLIPYPKRETN